MKKLIITFIAVLCLTVVGCTHILKPYQPPVQQGNVITSEMIDKLKPGLTKQQVTDILGPPVVINPFNDEVWTYIYTYQPSRGPSSRKQVIVYFKNNVATGFTINLPPPKKLKKKKIMA